MNNEMKVLAKKLMALFMCIALLCGIVPARTQAAQTYDFQCKVYDYTDTYYNGFNDNISVATGTFIGIKGGSTTNYLQVGCAVGKQENEEYGEVITVNDNESAYAKVSYQNGSVYLKIVMDSKEVYSSKLYTPKYVDLSEMPTISLGQDIDINNKYCKQYYRIDKSTISEGDSYKLYTVCNEDYDTYMFLYDAYGNICAQNDDSDHEYSDSEINLEFWGEGERIVSVQGYGYQGIDSELKFVKQAHQITKFESDNAERLNVFYEGFNDDLLYATGTRIKATLDNGTNNVWQSEGYTVEHDEYSDTDDVEIEMDEVWAKLYRGQDGAVYADYGLFDDTNTKTQKLFTPTIKAITDIPAITKGTVDIETQPEEGAYSYYRITAKEDEIWKLKFSGGKDLLYYTPMIMDLYESDGTFLYSKYQGFNDALEEFEDLEVEIEVPAGTTRIIGIYNYADISVKYSLTAALAGDEDETTENPTTGDVESKPIIDETKKDSETTSVVIPTKPNAENESTQSAEQKKIDAFKKAGKANIKKANKKKNAKQVKISLKKKLKGVDGYQIRFYKTKKNAKKSKKAIAKMIVKNRKNFSIKNKKVAKAKNLFVRVRAYIKVSGKTYTGKWSGVKKVTIK